MALRLVDADCFLGDAVRVTVDTVFVDSVVVASVSTGAVADEVAVEDAVAVSAADCSGRAQAAVITTTANAPAKDSLVTDRFPE